MADFALIGAAGFVAARHMRAIADTGHQLVAALDPKDSVGVIDQHFPDAHFFVEFERFDRHVDKLRRKGLLFAGDIPLNGREFANTSIGFCHPLQILNRR